MAVQRIVSPATWAIGTPAPADWFTNVQDTLNSLQGHLVGTKNFIIADDFMFPMAAAATSGVIGQNFVVSTAATKAKLITDTTVTPEANTFGVLEIQHTGGAGTSTVGIRSHYIYPGTLDFQLSIRVKVVDRSLLGAHATDDGLSIGAFSTSGLGMWKAASDETRWLFNADNGGAAAYNTADAPVISNNTWYTLETKRASGTVTQSVDGTVVFTETVASNATATILWINMDTSATTADDAPYVKVDNIKFLGTRP